MEVYDSPFGPKQVCSVLPSISTCVMVYDKTFALIGINIFTVLNILYNILEGFFSGFVQFFWKLIGINNFSWSIVNIPQPEI